MRTREEKARRERYGFEMPIYSESQGQESKTRVQRFAADECTGPFAKYLRQAVQSYVSKGGRPIGPMDLHGPDGIARGKILEGLVTYGYLQKDADAYVPSRTTLIALQEGVFGPMPERSREPQLSAMGIVIPEYSHQEGEKARGKVQRFAADEGTGAFAEYLRQTVSTYVSRRGAAIGSTDLHGPAGINRGQILESLVTYGFLQKHGDGYVPSRITLVALKEGVFEL